MSSEDPPSSGAGESGGTSNWKEGGVGGMRVFGKKGRYDGVALVCHVHTLLGKSVGEAKWGLSSQPEIEARL